MRCKNCGSENDDNLYICQNCGSPLYDEDDIDDTQHTDTVEEPIRRSSPNRKTQKAKEEEKKKQQTIIIIAVLAVLLVAIIAGVIIAVANSNKNEEDTTEPSSITEQSTTEEDSAYFTSKSTTQTTAATTKTTTTTTTTTTQAPKFNVSLGSNEGGEVEGDGSYKRGEHITVIARPDDGYEFDGWYKGSTRVSKNTKYTFTVKEDVQLEAVFTYVGFPDEPDEGEVVEP